MKAEKIARKAGLPPLNVNRDGALESVAPAINRDRWGRPILTDPVTGKARGYTRCTTYIDVLEDRSALEKWKVRTALLGVAEDQGIIRDAAAITKSYFAGRTDERTWKDTLNRLGEDALDLGGASVRSQAGTDLHALTEVVDRGLALPPGLVDDDFLDIAAYTAKRDELALKTVAIELFVVNDELSVAGTLDRVYALSGTFDHPTTGEPVTFKNDLLVGDVKTGAIHPGKVAMQVGIYSRSKRYDFTDGSRHDLPTRTDLGLLVHLPQGEATCAVYLIDLDLGFVGVSLAGQVRAWRNTGKRAIDLKAAL